MQPVTHAADAKMTAAKITEDQIDIETASPVPFDDALAHALAERGMDARALGDLSDLIVRRALIEYGAMFVAAKSVAVPPVCVFRSEQEVAEFQSRAGWRAANLDGATIELQPAALDALLAAREAAAREGLTISARCGAEAGRRFYDDTIRLWLSRVLPALVYWNERGALSREEAARILALDAHAQVPVVLELEARGIFFSKDFSKTILQSVAAPGASQHLAMLAFDAAEFQTARVREILAAHGWFQTVRSDLPHFTFLGLCEKELPHCGLRPLEEFGRCFWIPNIEEETISDE